MPYKKIKTLCLSSEIPYKEAKAKVYNIYRAWRSKEFEEQAAEATDLFTALQAIAQHKGRLINYTLDRFLKEIEDWGYKIYEEEKDLEAEEVATLKKELIAFVKAMLQTIKRGKTKTSDNLRAHLFRLIGEMLSMELRPEFLPILKDSMMVMNTDEQFFALEGLKYYFAREGTKLSKEWIAQLNKIVDTTTVRFNASNALDVLIHAGEIDELSAVIAMDDWKDRNYR